MPIDGDFFAAFLSVQGAFAFLFTAYAGPGLISPDLSNNALPLYLCRPISRTEYVLGKMAVLLYSAVLHHVDSGTLAVSMQAGLQGQGWGWDHIRLGMGSVRGLVDVDRDLALLAMCIVGMGSMEAGRQRAALRSILHLVGFRRNGE